MQNTAMIELTAWRGGNSGYGLRMYYNDRDRLFPQKKDRTNDYRVTVFLFGANDIMRVRSRITSSFWRTCSEFRLLGREKDIFKTWLKNCGGGLGWRRGYPHKYDATIKVDTDNWEVRIEVK